MIKVYLLILGFVSAFALTDITPLPMIVSGFVLIGLFLILSIRKKLDIPTSSITIFIYFLLFSLYIFGLFYTQGNVSTAINHALGYIAVIVMYHLTISFGMVNSKLEERVIFSYVSKGVILVTFIILVEFITTNLLSFDFDSIIYRSSVKEYNPTYNFSGSFFYRARGTMEESGPAAMYLLMFLPFLYYFFKQHVKSKRKAIWYLSLGLVAIFFTFSAIGFVELFVALTVCLFIYLIFDIKIYKKLTKVRMTTIIFSHFAIAISIMFFLLINPLESRFFDNIVKKATLSSDISSSQSRLDRWDLAMDLIHQKPLLGWGPGYISSVVGTGSTSLYMETTVSYGIIGLVLLLLVFAFYLRRIFKIDKSKRYFFLFSFTVSMMHYSVISSIWFPWVWTLFALIDFTLIRQKRLGVQ